jgi:hypothetical protein
MKRKPLKYLSAKGELDICVKDKPALSFGTEKSL